ncbi:MAG: carbamoyl-phosphate synthase large subunit, partial [Candidatus Altiarchaeota archaeon]
MIEGLDKVLVVGSGPIRIGQAAEFDYSGSQACLSLREEGITTVLVNCNPATIQTDLDISDIVYLEPLRADIIEKIIEKERPDGILPTMGGQTGLNLATELYDLGILDKYSVRVLGTSIDSIKMGEGREEFAELMKRIHEPIALSKAVKNLDDALAFVEKTGYPAIIRPGYTLGGTGGGIAFNEHQFIEIVERGIMKSRNHEVLVEEYVGGWKEIEYEVVRDAAGNCITVCNMENFDPMGIHTGESIVVAPSQTLNDEEYQGLRSAAFHIIDALGIQGGCNIQYALNPEKFDYKVIEVNPRVSRSSALASKATGYPIARVAAKIAVGYTLDEIRNEVTKETSAMFEPALDYVVVKIPRWPFDKFQGLGRVIGTEMRSTGEVMGIGRRFEEALQKAIRSLDIGYSGICCRKRKPLKDKTKLRTLLAKPTDLRLYYIYDALKAGFTVDEIHDITKVDEWFLDKLSNILAMEATLSAGPVGGQVLDKAKRLGFSDMQLAELTGEPEAELRRGRKKRRSCSVFKMVDTCAAEFEAKTPYYYSSYESESDVKKTGKKKVIILGAGPIRIGQGIEFDYCT